MRYVPGAAQQLPDPEPGAWRGLLASATHQTYPHTPPTAQHVQGLPDPTAGAPSRVPGVGTSSPEAQAQESLHSGPKEAWLQPDITLPSGVREAQRGHVQNGPSTLERPRAHALRACARRGARALPANAPLTQGRTASTLGLLRPPEDGRTARGVPWGGGVQSSASHSARQPRYQLHGGEEGQPECTRLGAPWPPPVPGPTSQEETSKGTVRELGPDTPRA